MRRVHTTFDLLEAHILVQMLREHGIEPWLFDAEMVRQDWFKAIAFGGYKILTRDDDVTQAHDVLRAYFDGGLALPAEADATCPRCSHAAGRDDPQPRRNVFLAMLLIPVAEFLVLTLLHWRPSAIGKLVVFALQIVVYATLPWFVIHYFKWPLRCADCGYRWRAPPAHRHAELIRLVEGSQAPPN